MNGYLSNCSLDVLLVVRAMWGIVVLPPVVFSV